MVAMAATETGVVYEGVFGSRRIHEGRVMTRDTIFRAATPNSATVITWEGVFETVHHQDQSIFYNQVEATKVVALPE